LARCLASDRLRLAALYQKLVHIYPPQGRMGESDAIYQKAVNVLGPEPGLLPAVDWWRTWLDIQLSRHESLYYQGRIDEMEKLKAQIEPVLEHYGTALHHLDYSGNQLMLIYRKKRFNLDLADLDYATEAVELAPNDDKMKRAYLEFGLGFGCLWANLLPQAIEYLLKALAGAEAMAYLPLQNQCVAYLTVALRLTGDVPQARQYQARSADLADQVGTPYYMGVVEANQAWLHYLDCRWELAIAKAQRALEHWQAFVYPFHWLAHWPLVAINLGQNKLASAIASADAMLDPVQQRFADDMTQALERAIEAGEAGESNEARRALEQAVALAKDYNYI